MIEDMSYVALCPKCHCVIAAIVDAPEDRKDVARTTADWVNRGFALNRMSCEEARTAKWCACTRPKLAAPPRSLFDART